MIFFKTYVYPSCTHLKLIKIIYKERAFREKFIYLLFSSFFFFIKIIAWAFRFKIIFQNKNVRTWKRW